MKENELKDAALDIKDFLTDDLKEEMRIELNKRTGDLISKLVRYVADTLKIQIDEKGGITGTGVELTRFLTLMLIVCGCEIKVLRRFKRKMKRRIEEQLSKVDDEDLNRKLS